MAKDATKKSPVTTATDVSSNLEDVGSNLEDEIRCRAYQLYEQRGREDGHDLDDWLSAEAEITETRVKVTAA